MIESTIQKPSPAARNVVQSTTASVAKRADDALWIEAGSVLRAHGVAGTLRLLLSADADTFTSDPETLRLVHRTLGVRVVSVASLRHIHGALLVDLAPALTREEAQAWRGARVEVPTSALAPLGPKELYPYELIGASLVSPQGEPLGTVEAIYDNGGQPLISLRDGAGKEQLLPFVPELCGGFDRERQALTVVVPEGLWDA